MMKTYSTAEKYRILYESDLLDNPMDEETIQQIRHMNDKQLANAGKYLTSSVQRKQLQDCIAKNGRHLNRAVSELNQQGIQILFKNSHAHSPVLKEQFRTGNLLFSIGNPNLTNAQNLAVCTDHDPFPAENMPVLLKTCKNLASLQEKPEIQKRIRSGNLLILSETCHGASSPSPQKQQTLKQDFFLSDSSDSFPNRNKSYSSKRKRKSSIPVIWPDNVPFFKKDNPNDQAPKLESRSTSVFFTGHREFMENEQNLRQKTREEILNCIEMGKDTFISEMAIGFDMLAAEEVIRARKEHPHIKLIAAVPNTVQTDAWNDSQVMQYNRILPHCNAIYELNSLSDLSQKEINGSYGYRDDWMVDNASIGIAYCSAKRQEQLVEKRKRTGHASNGTKKTFDHAKKTHVNVINVAQDPLYSYETSYIPERLQAIERRMQNERPSPKNPATASNQTAVQSRQSSHTQTGIYQQEDPDALLKALDNALQQKGISSHASKDSGAMER